MQDLEPLFLGRTFDDFLFRPQHTPVARRRDVDLSLPLTEGLDLSLPVVGANMDTVVGEEMAKTLALEGALGFLHRNATIAEQAERVRYVKSRHSYVIDRPVVLERTATMAQARKTIRSHSASGILIEETKGILSAKWSPTEDAIYYFRDEGNTISLMKLFISSRSAGSTLVAGGLASGNQSAGRGASTATPMGNGPRRFSSIVPLVGSSILGGSKRGVFSRDGNG